MSRIVYLNGEWLPEEEAKVSIFDRGYVFADAIYEVTCVLDGKLLDYDGHAARLKRSTDAIGIKLPVDDDGLLALHREIAERNDMREGLIYLQVSRGNPGDRDFMFEKDMAPTFSMFTQKKNVIESASAKKGITVVTLEDLRFLDAYAFTRRKEETAAAGGATTADQLGDVTLPESLSRIEKDELILLPDSSQ